MDKVEKNNLGYIQVRFNEKFANFFDSIQNADISNRKSDTGFTEKDRPMLGPRPGTERIGDTLVSTWSAGTYPSGVYVTNSGAIYKSNTSTSSIPPGSGWDLISPNMQSVQYFYTDKSGLRRHYRIFDKSLYYLVGNIWTKIRDVGTNDVDFAVHRIPVMIDGSTPVNWTTPAVATGSEKIQRDLGDGAAAGNFFNVGKIALITSGIYKGCYAPILSYDDAKKEYSLSGSGIITNLAAGTTYRLFETVSEVLQISRASIAGTDIYFNGVTELSYVEGYATASLKNIIAILPSQSMAKMVIFNNQCWTFGGGTLFYTGGFPGNPLFFNYTGSLSVGGNGTIVDIFPYKNRLVIIGSNYIYSVKSDLSIDRNVTAFGGIKGAYVNTGDDVYILTTQQTMVSLSETINGVVSLTNIGEPVDNYVKTYKTMVAFGFDSRRIFLYGQPNVDTEGVMCVFDIKRKMWTTYTGLRPRSIVSDGSKVYLNDNNSDIVRSFNSEMTTDVVVGTNQIKSVAMSVTLKEIDFDDIFSPKTMRNLWFSFENVSQTVWVDVYMSNTLQVGKKKRIVIPVVPENIEDITLGEGNLGENTFGISDGLDIISISKLVKVDLEADSANTYKIVISGKDGSPFYITQMDIGIVFKQDRKTYFSAGSTI